MPLIFTINIQRKNANKFHKLSLTKINEEGKKAEVFSLPLPPIT